MSKKTTHKLKVFGFRAVNKPSLCMEYVNGHIKVLADYGIENITSNNESWTNNPNIYCLGLIDEFDELLGGIRIQIADGIHPLPVEEAIGEMDKNIHKIVEDNAINGGIGELSGLWINNKLRGFGAGVYMVRAAIASSIQLNFKTMIGICGDVTLQMFTNVGFIVEESLGKNGTFLYPNKELIAHAVGILDAISLNNAANHDKTIMEALRLKPQQERIEIDTGKNVPIKYNLVYPHVEEVKYQKQSNGKIGV